MAEKALLIDVRKCMACRGCQVACKQWNQLPAEKTTFTGTYQNPPDLSPTTWTLIRFKEVSEGGKVKWLFWKTQCLHCTDATCLKVCPVPGAITRMDDGTIYLDSKKCTGCKYCVMNCPFEVPKYDRVKNKASKCNLCYDRTSNGLPPACAKTCPTGAIRYGDRDELLAYARGKSIVYGEKELKGLHVMYLLPEEPTVYDLPKEPKVPTTAILWRDILRPIGLILGGGSILAWLGYHFLLMPQKEKLTKEAEKHS